MVSRPRVVSESLRPEPQWLLFLAWPQSDQIFDPILDRQQEKRGSDSMGQQEGLVSTCFKLDPPPLNGGRRCSRKSKHRL